VTADPTGVASAAEHALTLAAKPFLQRARFALTKRGLLRDRDAAGRLAQIPGPHSGLFSALKTIKSLPHGVTYAQIIKVIELPAFRVYSQQLIAVHIANRPPMAEQRIYDALLDLFVSEIYAIDSNEAELLKANRKEEFRPAFNILWDSLQSSCANVFKRLTEYPITSGVTFNWAQSTLSLATIESLDRYISNLSRSSTHDNQSWVSWITDYRKAFIRTHSTIPVPDLAVRRQVSYEILFTPPNFIADVINGSLTIQIVRELVDRTVILGDPGAGKSTVSTLLAVEWSEKSGPAFFLPLRTLNIDDSGFDVVREIETVLRRRYQRSAPSGLIDRLLLEGSALIVFDGLDEVESVSRRKAVVQAIEETSTSFPLCKIIVTSRRIGYQAVRLQSDIFREMRILPFDTQQVEEYVRAWFGLDSSLDESTLPKTVSNFMKTSLSIPELRQNPLMLSYICVLYRGYNDIPRRRSEIYSKCVELLLHSWDMSRGMAVAGWEVDIYEVALIEIGYLILTRPEYQSGMTERQLNEIAAGNLLTELVPNKREAERLARAVIERCRGRGWIFTDVGLNEEGDVIFSFVHRSFLEYFAAQHLVRETSSPVQLAHDLMPHIFSGHGEILAQVCISLVGRSKTSGGSSVILEMLKDSVNRPPSEAFTALQFIISCTDAVPVNRDALSAVISRLLDSLHDMGTVKLANQLMDRSFRHTASVDDILYELLKKRFSTSQSALDDVLRMHPWLWDFCLQHQVVSLDVLATALDNNLPRIFARLFEGSLASMTERLPVTSGLALLNTAFNKDTPRDSRLQAISDLSTLRIIIGDASNLDVVVGTMNRPPDYLVAHLNKAYKICERAVKAAAGHRPEVLSTVVFMILAVCEIVVEALPYDAQPQSGLIRELLDYRTSMAYQFPIGVDRLPANDGIFVRNWCQSRVTMFLWEDNYGAVDVS
jgi:hypothetical protein